MLKGTQKKACSFGRTKRRTNAHSFNTTEHMLYSTAPPVTTGPVSGAERRRRCSWSVLEVLRCKRADVLHFLKMVACTDCYMTSSIGDVLILSPSTATLSWSPPSVKGVPLPVSLIFRAKARVSWTPPTAKASWAPPH